MTNKVLSVPDIPCAHCERTIKGAVEPIVGIESVRVDIPEHLVSVEYDEMRIGLDRIAAVLQEEGYPVATATSPEVGTI